MKLRGFVLGDRIIGQAADSHSDWCAAFGRHGAYRVIAASAIGKLHLRDGRPRDDAFAVRASGAWLAVAVSDGAGSREASRYGSTFVVEALCEHLLREATGVASLLDVSALQLPEVSPTAEEESSEKPSRSLGNLAEFVARLIKPSKSSAAGPPPTFEALAPLAPPDEVASAFGTLTWAMKDLAKPSSATTAEGSSPVGPQANPPLDIADCILHAFRKTRLALEQFAQSRNLALRDIPCTLLGLLLNTETGAAGSGHVGDGLIAFFHPGWGARPMVEPPASGEVGEVYVLTQSDWEKFLAVRAHSPEETGGISNFYLMTDGVADDCTHPPPDDIFQRWARDIDRELRKDEPLPQTATCLLRWLASYEVKGSWDDRTLLAILRS